MDTNAKAFETHRPALLALAYRMLGDMARAEDMVQETWVRWQGATADVDAPKAFLITTITRLCLDELGSARARHEESRSDRLPEPVDLHETGLHRLEMLDRVSMAFLVLLQRLAPAERAALLLHDVFEMNHAEIAAMIGKSQAACRQLLSRARQHVASEKRVFETSEAEHRRLLRAFVQAAMQGDQSALLSLLAEDAVAIADGGPKGTTYGKLRNVGHPVVGRKKVAAVIGAFAAQKVLPEPVFQERVLNGEPSMVMFRSGRAEAALLISVADGQVQHVFIQIDRERLKHIGPLN